MTMCGLDVTSQALVTPEIIDSRIAMNLPVATTIIEVALDLNVELFWRDHAGRNYQVGLTNPQVNVDTKSLGSLNRHKTQTGGRLPT